MKIRYIYNIVKYVIADKFFYNPIYYFYNYINLFYFFFLNYYRENFGAYFYKILYVFFNISFIRSTYYNQLLNLINYL